MPIPYQTEQWLKNAGYRYCCFISWPRVNKYMAMFARRLKVELEEQLAEQIHRPTVFLDEQEIPAGARWRTDLQQSLCESVSMIALCAPIYFHPQHIWCGLEWAAMQQLGHVRFRDARQTAIIPIVVSEILTKPRAFDEVQYIDVSHERTRGRGFLQSNAFRETVSNVTRRIEEIATIIHDRGSHPNCRSFDFPSQTAFPDYVDMPQPLPLTGK